MKTYIASKEELTEIIQHALKELFEQELPTLLRKANRKEWLIIELIELAGWTLTVFQLALPTHRRCVRITNAERLHQELKRRSKPVRIFPNLQSCLRLFGAILKEQHKDWIMGRRYLKMDGFKDF